MHTRSFLALVLLAILASAATIATAATLPAAEDSSSSRGKLTAATNRATTLRVDATHSGYIYFDLAAVPATTAAQIRYARLRLFLPKVTANGGGLTVHVVTSPWDEAVPAAAPSHDPAVAATIGALTLRSKRFVSVDVTAAVQAWVAGSVANDGFAILSVSGTNVLVSAKEGSGTGYPAELDVELNPDGGSITSAQLADNLTLGGTTAGTFTGNGAGLLSLTAANLTGQLTNAQLANSGFALNLGSGLSGSGTVALGGTLNLNNTGVLSLAAGGGVTVSAANGDITLGSTATDANTPGSIVQRDASGGFAAGGITAANTTVTSTIADSPVLSLKGSAGQTAALIEFRNAGNSVLASVDAGGNLSAANFAGSGSGLIDINGSSLTVGSVDNGRLTNSSITVAAGNGLSGGGLVSLGGNVTLSLGSNLTLGGTTTGSFSGNLSGNATTSTTAGSFTGALVGDVTGTQATTVVSTVGGVSAVSVAAGTSLANAATSANTAGTLVLRDASGSFSAGTVTANGSLHLPATGSATVGVILQAGSPLIHTFGTDNFFAGPSAGNFTMTGSNNTANGYTD